MKQPTVGVLALQGDVREHLAALTDVGANATAVRRPHELDAVDALVVPGGESTTIGKLLVTFELLEPLQKRVRDGMPAFGSCAGMILLADRVLDGTADQVGVGGIAMAVRRNAFGRQVDSFEAELPWPSPTGRQDEAPNEAPTDALDKAGETGPLRAVFIRAPWVEDCADEVQVLARAADRIVAVQQGALLATAFHPELTSDRRVHAHFVSMVREHLR